MTHAYETQDVSSPTVEKVALDSRDPFEAGLIELVAMNRKKRADYAADDNVFSNFEDSSYMIGLPGFGPKEAALFNVCQKIARLRSLRANGRMTDTQNESVNDTYLDLAVYASILFAMRKESQ